MGNTHRELGVTEWCQERSRENVLSFVLFFLHAHDHRNKEVKREHKLAIYDVQKEDWREVQLLDQVCDRMSAATVMVMGMSFSSQCRVLC